jgi:hypothetical protein
LKWEERVSPPHAALLRLYTAFLRLRRELVASGSDVTDVEAVDQATVMISRVAPDQSTTAMVVRLHGEGVVTLPGCDPSTVRVVMTTEDAEFSEDGRPPRLVLGTESRIHFSCPAAIVIGAHSRVRHD